MATDENKKVEAYRELGKQLGINNKLIEEEGFFEERILDLANSIQNSKKRQEVLDERRNDLSQQLLKVTHKSIVEQQKYSKLDDLHIKATKQIRVLNNDNLAIWGKLSKLKDDIKDPALTDQAKQVLDTKIKEASVDMIASSIALQQRKQERADIVMKKGNIRDLLKYNNSVSSSLSSQITKIEKQLELEQQLVKSEENRKKVLEKLRGQFGGIQDTLESLKFAFTNPVIIFATGLAMVIGRFKEMDAAAADFRKSTGLTKDQTSDLTNEVEKMSLKYGAFGVDVKAGYEAASALTKEFGVMNEKVTDNANTVALLHANMGVANESAAGFVGYLDRVGNMSTEQIKSMSGYASNLSKAAGIPLDKVMEDVAHASEQAKAMTGGNVANLIKASAQARKFGVDLNKAAAAARGMLDFNESINSELEASVLLGKNLSFMDARRAAFNHDIAGAQEATLKEMEKMGDFNSLNVLQQEALAKASGYSVSDLQKMLKMKKEFNKMSVKDREEYTRLMKMHEEDAKNTESNLLEEAQMQSVTDTLANSWKTIKNAVSAIFMPMITQLVKIVPYVAMIANGFAGWVNDLNEGWKVTIGIGASLFGIIATVKTLSTLKSFVGGGKESGGGIIGTIKNMLPGKATEAIGGLPKIAGEAKPSLGEGFAGFMKSFAKGIGYLGDPKVGAGVLAMIGMSAALVIAAYGFSIFKDIKFEDIGVALAGIIGLTAAVIGLGMIMGTGVGFAAIVLGTAALAAMGLAMLPFGIAALAAGAGMNMMADGLIKIIPQLSTLASISGGLLLAAGAITALGGAFAVFGAGQAYAGLGSFVGGLLGGDQIKELERLAKLGPQLQVTANAIKTISNPSADNSSSPSSSASSNEAVVKKLDELIGLMKSGGIAVNLDGRRVSSGLAAAVS